MEKAIKLAIDGGLKEGENWKFVTANRYWVVWLNGNGDSTSISTSIYLLDPLFWQALGKQQGWEYWLCEHCGNNVCYRGSGPTNSIPVAQCVTHGDVERIEGYKYHWHSFIDHIAEGKSVDSFFNQILK